MSGIMRLFSGLVAAMAILALFEVSGQMVSPGKIGLISKAEAIIGRPLTPMSYAGVARRTVRRCAAGVYFC